MMSEKIPEDVVAVATAVAGGISARTRIRVRSTRSHRCRAERLEHSARSSIVEDGLSLEQLFARIANMGPPPAMEEMAAALVKEALREAKAAGLLS
jgi:hypothetical protein